MLVRDVFQLGANKIKSGDLGIEIEVEGERLPETPTYFRMERDGSLRGPEAIEYVFDKPRSLKGTRKALDYLDKKFTERRSNFHESIRAGVHVHVNVQELNLVELYNLFTLYLLLEELLVRYCGPSRQGNLFCLRAGDAEYLISMLKEAVRTKRMRLLHTDDLRYAAMNVKALRDYGSVEFRAMRSTRDFDAIYNWAAILLELRQAAKGWEDPTRIISLFSELGAEEFVRSVLGDLSIHLEPIEGWDELLYDGMRNAQDLAYCTDWSKVMARKTANPFVKPEDVWV